MKENAPPLRQTSRMVVTDPTAAVEELLKENRALSDALAELQARMPNDEDLAFLHNLRIEREHAAWVWKLIRNYAPWVTAVCGTVGSAVYWFLHTFQVRQP
ncbi:MAG: hypothetical protein RJA36_1315 [Pseudomonadota bacterium]|jgi:thiamine pyrophosphate-dependent acetolactate synthase large subunit-like protein